MSEPLSIRFLGAAGTVTGSKHLVTFGDRRVLLDCGLFQGIKELRERNWKPPPIPPSSLDAIVVSHAHIDHVGALPIWVKHGFRGKIYCTSATADLIRILLPDSAHLEEEDAERANRRGYSKHRPALPLFTIEDAEAAIRLLETRRLGEEFAVVDGIRATYRRVGHILGSSAIELGLGNGDGRRIVFSGDVGRWDRPILRDPDPVDGGDVLILESTYGDRVHPPGAADQLARIVNEAARRGGALVVPAFAVGRSQELLWLLRSLEGEKRIPALPIFLDSPMAVDATEIYCRHPEDHDLPMRQLTSPESCPFWGPHVRATRSAEESKKINDVAGPVIIISASGMATGGRVLHHLKLRLPDPKTTVLLVGFQAPGTRGRQLQDGAGAVRIHGELVEVRAKVESMSGLSAHGDRNELLRWASGLKRPPRDVYLVHGEPGPAQALAGAIVEKLGWPARPAQDGETVAVA